MAATFVTLPTPFLHKTSAFSFSNKRFPGTLQPFHLCLPLPQSYIILNPLFSGSCAVLKRNSLKINAVATKWEPTKVVPQADRVLLRLEELSDKTAGGVLLPKSAVKYERYLVGEILSVGAEAGEVKAGTKVLFTDINAYEVDLGTAEKHCFCKASDLLAVVE